MKLNILPPALIVYTDALPDDVGGRATGPIVRIKPKYQCDEGIHKHELAHVEMWWLTLGLIWIAELLFKRVRLWNEARAYRVQMEYQDCDSHYMTLDDAAGRLASAHYGFAITLDQAKAMLEPEYQDGMD